MNSHDMDKDYADGYFYESNKKQKTENKHDERRTGTGTSGTTESDKD